MWRAVGLWWVPQVALAVPMELQHQGRLLDDQQLPLDGDFSVTFNLYDAPAGGTALWTETRSTSFDRGFYSTTLGERPQNPLDDELFDVGSLYLGLKVGSAAELSPRVQIVSVPFARRAGRADVSTSLSGGAVDATQILVNGVTVIDGSGQVVASVAGASLDELGCQRGEVPQYDGGAWGCSSPDAFTVPWTEILDVPADLLDGDADALIDLAQLCDDGQYVRWDEDLGSYECATLDGRTFARSNAQCNAGYVVNGTTSEGLPICVPDQDTRYDGSDFALAGQSCSIGQVVTGISPSGAPICAADRDTTYDGSTFALSNRSCPGGQVVVGVSSAGTPLCAPDRDTTYNGTNFALSGRACPSGLVQTGVDASGAPVCAVDQNNTYNGTNFALSGRACPSGQVQTGVSSTGTPTCAVDQNTTYDGRDFALAGRSCPSGQYMTGIGTTGAPICASLSIDGGSCPSGQFLSGLTSGGGPVCSDIAPRIREVVRSQCFVYLGWRDNCSGCGDAPAKWGRVSQAGCTNLAGGSNVCITAGGINLYGVNTDGGVDDNDQFYIGLNCP